MTDYDNIYEDFIHRPDGPYFRLLTLLPKPEEPEDDDGDTASVGSEEQVIQRLEEYNINADTDEPEEPENTDIELELSIHPFEGCPEYEALSYSWGDPDGRRSVIKCNGYEFHALPSLTEALRALRLPDKPRTLWIDAICINQNVDSRAITERTQQLQIMEKIYRNAKRSVVWLGEQYNYKLAPAFDHLERSELHSVDPDVFREGVESAISLHLEAFLEDPAALWKDQVEIESTWGQRVHLIKQSALRIRQEWDSRTEDDPRNKTFAMLVDEGMGDEVPKFFRKSAKFLMNSSKIRKAAMPLVINKTPWRMGLRNILCREWWSRKWIIQEVCLAKDVILLCGKASFNLDLLFLGLVIYSLYPFDAVFSGTIMSSWTLPEVMSYRTLYQQPKAVNLPSLLHLLTEFRFSDATNPKDHVYALLGLLSPTELSALKEAGFAPKYSKEHTVSDCYIETASSILSASKTLDMLALPQPGQGESSKSKADKLPSWVPDWSAKTVRIQTPRHGYETDGDTTGQSVFSACGSCYQSNMSVKDGQLLVVSGYATDTVTSTVTTSISSHMDLMEYMQSIEANLMDMDGMDEENFKPMNFFLDVAGGFTKALRTIFEWEKFIEARASPYPTGEDIERVGCAVRCFGFTPDGLDSAVSDFQEYKKAMNKGRRVYNLVLSPSRPTLPKSVSSFFKRKTSENDAPGKGDENSKLREALMAFGTPGPKSQAKMTKFNKLQAFSVGRKLAWTEKGYLALVPEGTEVGDKIVLCKGSRLPLVLKAADAPNQWKALNGCYVHGIMKGEAWDETKCVEMHLI